MKKMTLTLTFAACMLLLSSASASSVAVDAHAQASDSSGPLVTVDCHEENTNATEHNKGSCEADNPVYSPKCKYESFDAPLLDQGTVGCRNPATGCLAVSWGGYGFVCD